MTTMKKLNTPNGMTCVGIAVKCTAAFTPSTTPSTVTSTNGNSMDQLFRLPSRAERQSCQNT